MPPFSPTDNVYVDEKGGIYTLANRNLLANVGVFAFADNGALQRNDHGLFTGGQPQASENYVIHHKWLERSNSNMVQEMVAMMSAQRALQSAAEMSKIYDQVITKDTTELGRM